MSNALTHIETEKQLVPALRFKEFDRDWNSKPLKEITSYVDYRGRGPEKSEQGVFLVTAKNIKKGFIDYECSKEYVPTENRAIVMSKGLPQVGDILFTTEAPLGNVAQVDNSDIALAQRVIKFRGNKELLNDYLLHFMIGPVYQKLINRKANGTTVLGISGKELHKTKIQFPSLPEQQKIASFLSAVDEKIQQLTKKKALLSDYKKGVMQQLFSGQLRFKDENGKDYPDWEEKRLLEFCTFFSGGTPSSTNKKFYSGTIPFIGSGNIYDSEVFNFISEEALNSSSAKIVEEGDLLYALYGANSGEVAISQLEGAINQAILCIRTKESIEYLYYVLLGNKDNIIAKYLQGGQGNLSAQIIKKLKYKFPSIEEQQKIAAYLSGIDTKIESVNNQITQTQTFKKGLLQQMFV
jgi:type I restriction enzyme S subunit